MASYSNDQLAKIRECAKLFFSPREIAIIMEFPVSVFLEDCHEEEHTAYKAFYAGRLESEMELRRSIIKLSQSGSSPAQTMAMDLLNKSQLKILDK